MCFFLKVAQPVTAIAAARMAITTGALRESLEITNVPRFSRPRAALRASASRPFLHDGSVSANDLPWN